MPRVNSEDKLGRQQHRKSLATPPSGPVMSSSATDLDKAIVDTPGRRSRKSFIAPGVVGLGQQQGSVQVPLSLSSLATMAAYGPEVTKKFKPFYTRVIGGLMVLEKDPDPNTADMAKSVLDTVWARMTSQDRERQSSVFRSFSQADVHSSVSAPSSPQVRFGTRRQCHVLSLNFNLFVTYSFSFTFRHEPAFCLVENLHRQVTTPPCLQSCTPIPPSR